MSEPKTYDFEGGTFVLLEPFYAVMEHIVSFNSQTAAKVVDLTDLVSACGDGLPQFVAGLITPQGVNPGDRDLAAIARQLWLERPSKLKAVVADFFGHPDFEEEVKATGILIRDLTSMVGNGFPGRTPPGTSEPKSASSPEETSSSGTESGGESAPEKPETT